MTRGQFYLTSLQSLLDSDFKVVITCSGYTMNMLFQVIPCSDRLCLVIPCYTSYNLVYQIIVGENCLKNPVVLYLHLVYLHIY